MTLGLAMIVAFCVWERFAQYPMIPGFAFQNKVRFCSNDTDLLENLDFDTIHYRSRWSQFLFAS